MRSLRRTSRLMPSQDQGGRGVDSCSPPTARVHPGLEFAPRPHARRPRRAAVQRAPLLEFPQAAMVGKTDVVKRLLHAMKHNGMAPCQELWRRVLKMMSSRENFSTCLVVKAFFRNVFPNDKRIWCCLVNVALEVGDAESARSTLQQYQKAELGINGHVPLFRTFTVLKDADAAETVFHELGAEASPLMLNLLLLTCVNNGSRAQLAALGRSPRAGGRGSQSRGRLWRDCRRIDAVSYNTAMKDFAQRQIG